MFPEERRNQILLGLGQNVRAIISQRLIPTVDGKRAAAVEVLLGNKTVEDLIIKGDFPSIKEIMNKSENLGMQTFDGALYHLYKQGKITLEQALKNADSENNLRLRIKLGDNKPEAKPAAIKQTAPKAAAPAASGLELSLMDDNSKEEAYA